jgi:hypothetical protein
LPANSDGVILCPSSLLVLFYFPRPVYHAARIPVNAEMITSTSAPVMI